MPRPPNIITTSISPIGVLASTLFRSEAALLRAEKALERMLDSLYGANSWQDYSYDRHEAALDVYGVVPSEAAVGALFLAGFVVLTEHTHVTSKFMACACRARRAS